MTASQEEVIASEVLSYSNLASCLYIKLEKLLK
jgi:hypothetical protein